MSRKFDGLHGMKDAKEASDSQLQVFGETITMQIQRDKNWFANARPFPLPGRVDSIAAFRSSQVKPSDASGSRSQRSVKQRRDEQPVRACLKTGRVLFSWQGLYGEA